MSSNRKVLMGEMTYRRTMAVVAQVEGTPRSLVGEDPRRPLVRGTDPVPVEVVGWDDGNGWALCDVYASGTSEDPTEEDQPLRLLGVPEASGLLPVGSYWVAVPLPWSVGGDVAYQYTVLNTSPVGGSLLMRITGLHTDSPTTGVRMYKGDIYANGTGAVATQSDVTVRIPGVAANVTVPGYGSWSNLPACIGVRTTATWIGATVTHTNDTVYEAVGLLLVV